MRFRKRTFVIGGGVVLAGVVSAISFAASTAGSATISASANTSTVANVYASVTAGPYGTTMPSMSPALDQVGATTAGDLYNFATGTSGDILVTLYLNNAGQLANDYSYLNDTVTIYQGSGTSWTKAKGISGNTASKVLSLTNGYVTFNLPAPPTGDIYAVAIDGGSFYTTATTAADLGPNFYLSVQPSGL